MNTGHIGVDWRRAPKRARWWAINKDGFAFWFCEPDIAFYSSYWFSDTVPAPAFGFAGNFKKSLTQRPVRHSFL